MQSGRAKTATFAFMLFAVLVVALAALFLEEPIRERWWRWRLLSSDIATSRRAARSLVRMAEARAKVDFEHGHHRRALRWLTSLESLFRTTGSTENEIVYLIGESHFGLRDYQAAIPWYRRVLETSSDTALEKAAAHRVYSIGRAFLAGEAKLRPGVSTAESRTFAVNLLVGDDGVMTTYPFFFEGDRASMEIARLSMEAGAYATALAFYGKVLRDDNSDLQEEAHFGFAVANLRRTAGDPTQRRNAKRLFERYCSDYPTGAKIEEARRYLREIQDADF